MSVALVQLTGAQLLEACSTERIIAVREDSTNQAGSIDASVAGTRASELRSCLDLSRAPNAVSGYQLIDPDGPDGTAPFEVYCNMELSDGQRAGGWTLVARSVAAAQVTSFGWRQSTGSPRDDAEPYSLNIARPGFSFSQVAVTDYSRGKDVGGRAYILDVPADFETALLDSAVLLGPVETALGDCRPDGGPNMFNYVGYTRGLGHYFFRDNPEYADWLGLFSDGFRLHYENCDRTGCGYGACLSGSQGMIFVR